MSLTESIYDAAEYSNTTTSSRLAAPAPAPSESIYGAPHDWNAGLADADGSEEDDYDYYEARRTASRRSGPQQLVAHRAWLLRAMMYARCLLAQSIN
jgi:hypothetical protein